MGLVLQRWAFGLLGCFRWGRWSGGGGTLDDGDAHVVVFDDTLCFFIDGVLEYMCCFRLVWRRAAVDLVLAKLQPLASFLLLLRVPCM